MHKVIILFFLFIMPISLMAKLDNESRKKLENGEMIVKTSPLKNSPWPEHLIYTEVGVTPLEAMAIFAAFNHQKNYVPNMLHSKVITEPRPLQTTVEYEMDIPWPLSNAKYIMKHQIKKRGNELTMLWEQVESNTTLNSYGSVTFGPTANGKTLMVYNSIVIPDSTFAGLVKSKATSDMTATVKAIKNYTESLKKMDSKLFNQLINHLQDSLAGKKVYLP